MPRVIGVDGCPGGWVGITDDAHAYFGATIDELVTRADADGRVDVVAIDIPIGLPQRAPRRTDAAVRATRGKRRSSVFATPIRAALEAATHAEASLVHKEATGSGISRQSFALKEKILDVDRWVGTAGRTVIEVHPELSFQILAGRGLDHRKSSWAGAEERRTLLRRAGVVIPDDLGEAGEKAAVDDVLDAAVASWSARRHLRGEAVAHPESPEVLDDAGTTATIWA